MKIVKYSKIKEGQVKASNIVGGGGGSSTTIEGGSVSLDRTIWGKQDSGDDIDGHMIVNGDVRIQAIEYNWEEDDDEDGSGEDEEYDEGGGNLFVDLKVKAKEFEADEDVSVGRHLYISYPHPAHSATKKCVGEILKENEDAIKTETDRAKAAEKANSDAIAAEVTRAQNQEDTLDTNIQDCETAIRNNAEEIAKLKQRSDSSETDISGIIERVATNETNISNNTTEINAIKEQLADGSALAELQRQVEALKYGNYSTPIILFAGILRKYSTTDSYMYNGSYKDCIQFRITDITDGLMTIELTPTTSDKNMYIYVRSVNATQEMSDDTKDRSTYYKGRSNGAHWFESWFNIETNKTTIYLREFHQGNGDNDTWYSSSWFEDGGPRAVNLTINGYISFIS